MHVTRMSAVSLAQTVTFRGKWTLSAYPKSRKQKSLTDSAEILMTSVSLSNRGHVLLENAFHPF